MRLKCLVLKDDSLTVSTEELKPLTSQCNDPTWTRTGLRTNHHRLDRYNMDSVSINNTGPEGVAPRLGALTALAGDPVRFPAP